MYVYIYIYIYTVCVYIYIYIVGEDNVVYYVNVHGCWILYNIT